MSWPSTGHSMPVPDRRGRVIIVGERDDDRPDPDALLALSADLRKTADLQVLGVLVVRRAACARQRY
jgi:hypothetical protein